MKSFACLVVFAAVLLVRGYADMVPASSEVLIEYMNPKFFDTRVKDVTTNDSTSGGNNTINLVSHLVKEFPQNTKVKVKLHRMDPESQRTKLMYSLIFTFCKGDETPAVFPGFFNVIEIKSKCLDKTHFQLNNLKYFDLTDVVPDLEKKGKMFKLDFTVYSVFQGKILKGYNIVRLAPSTPMPSNDVQVTPSSNPARSYGLGQFGK